MLRLAHPLVIVLLTSALRAEENRYDALGKVLTPFVGIFASKAKNADRAMLLSGRIEQMTGLPPELAGARAELALQTPDKLRLRAPVLGEELTVCRNGRELWAFPGAKIEALLAAASTGKKLSPLDPKARLEPFELPIPAKQLVFLPALFQVKDVGSESLDGEPCRVLDLFLLPELARSLKAQGWAARLWIGRDGKPARLSIAKPGWNLVVRFERVEFSPALPPETWQPSSDQAADVLKLDAARYEQLLGAIWR